MVTIQPLSNQISISTQPTADDLRIMAAEGVRSVVNLVPGGEDPAGPTPEEEGRLTQELGMRYLYVPVAMNSMQSPQRVEEFMKGLARLPRPVHVHCRLGRRAGVYAAIAIGVEQGLSGAEALQRVRQLGFDPGAGELAEFVKNQVDEYQVKVQR